jgi:hypothetical protein
MSLCRLATFSVFRRVMSVLKNEWALKVMVLSACSFIVLVFTVSLHVLAYMAIFRYVWYFIFICLKDSASLLFSCLFPTWSHAACFHLRFFPLFSFVIFVSSVCVCLLALSLLFVCSVLCLLDLTFVNTHLVFRRVVWFLAVSRLMHSPSLYMNNYMYWTPKNKIIYLKLLHLIAVLRTTEHYTRTLCRQFQRTDF